MRTSFGVRISHLKPTQKHRIAMWGVMGAVIAMNDEGEVARFDGLTAWEDAIEFAGVSEDRDPRRGPFRYDSTVEHLAMWRLPRKGQTALFIREA